jgi:nitrous oxide reductase
MSNLSLKRHIENSTYAKGKEAIMKENKELNQGRRDLLKGLTTAAVAGAVVAGTTKAATAAETISPGKEVKKTGYHETQHIRDYYETL